MIGKNDIKDMYFLSPMQEGILFHYLMDKESPAYFEQTSYRIRGELDYRLFEQSFNRLIERYDVLRTIFVYEKVQRALQVVLKRRKTSVYYQDLSHLNRDEQERWLMEFKRKDTVRGFDLGKDILIRLAILKISDQRYEVIWSFHHILMDGWCISILVKDMLLTYYSLARGKTVDLEPPVPYKNYIKWLEKQDKGAGINYWKCYLEGYETHAVIPGGIEGKTNKYEMHVYQFRIDRELSKEFTKLSNENNVTVSTIFQALWGILLQRYNNTDDIVFGSVVSGRPARLGGVEKMVGLFINAIPVRVKTEYGDTFVTLLEKNQAQMIQSRAYEFVPLAEIQSNSLLKRELLDHIVIFENYPVDKEIKDLGRDNISLFSVESVELFEQTSYDLNIFVTFMGELAVKIKYNAAVYNDNVIKELEERLVRIIEQVTVNPGIPVEEIELISASEKSQVLFDFNRTETRYPKNKTVHGLFEEQVAKTPDVVAVTGPSVLNASPRGLQYTYRELNEACNRLSCLLREKRVQPGTIVGIMVERSVEMVIGILGILKAGGAYLPIEPGSPRERINFMVIDSGLRILLNHDSLVESIETSTLPEPLKSPNASSPHTHPYRTAYVIYTSGSTGRPKGVIVDHAPVVNLLFALQNRYPFDKTSTYLLKTSYIFDVSVTELFGWYMGGGRLAVLETGGEKDPGVMLDRIERDMVSHINFVPSIFKGFIEQFAIESTNRLCSLKYIFLAGEALLPELVEKFRNLNIPTALEDIYGPTENTVYASGYSLSAWGGNGSIPIGKPLPNIELYILNKCHHPQPLGVTGELCISGAGLSRGYLNRQELTSERFIHLTLSTGTNTLLYKTGDLSRWLQDGNIEFLGRLDHQVKIRGFRVELSEIENQLLKHPQIKEAIVEAREDRTGDKNLTVYFVSDIELPDTELRQYLAKGLPDFMIPSYFVHLAQVPLTTSGKVDHKALPEPELKVVGTCEAPRDDIERKLVKIWSELLGIASASSRSAMGIDSNFFELGGHSLKAIVLAARIHKEFDVKVPLTVIFKSPTVRGLSGYIKDVNDISNDRERKYAPLVPVEKKEYYPVSLPQKRFYMIQYLNPADINYNLVQSLILEGYLEREKLEKTFKSLIQRHENLRTSFEFIYGEPVQKIHDNVELHIEFSEAPEDRAGHILRSFVKPFRLDKAPLFRVGLIKFAEDRHLLIIDMHHIITDGLSFVILSAEFIKLYEGQALPPVSIQYTDFSEWQYSESEKERLKKQGEFWIKQFELGIPLLTLRTDFPRPPVRSTEGNVMYFTIALNEMELLRRLVLREGTSIFIALFTIYIILLWRLSGQTDIVVGTGSLNRTHTDLMTIPGLFFNTIPLRNQVEEEMSFLEFLKTVKDNTLAAFENQEYPLDMLMVELTARGVLIHVPNRTPFFDNMFAEQNFQDAAEVDDSGARLTGLTARRFGFEKNVTRFDLFLQFSQAPNGIHMRMEYSTALFKPSTARNITENYKEILKQVLENQKIIIKDITISNHLLKAKDNTDEEEYMAFGF